LFVCWTAWAAPAPDGAALYKQHCASCHDVGGTRAPSRSVMKQLAPEAILRSLEGGTMTLQGTALSPTERRTVAEFLTGKPFVREPGALAQSRAGYCADAPRALTDPSATPHWNGWGVDLANRRFQSAEMAGLRPEQVPRLKLKWAFGFPGAIVAFAQPTIVGGRVFASSPDGTVYSLDSQTGCINWSFSAASGVRTAITIAPLPGAGLPRHAAYFGDFQANAYAVDAATGKLIWKTRVEEYPIARVTGSPQWHDGRLYVPVSSVEEVPGANPKYECCRFRGSVAALDAATGAVIWKSYTIPDPPRPTRKNKIETQLWGPSGASIWSAPTLDLKRKAVYVTTGDSYSDPAAQTSDAILAFDMDSGKLLWSRQMTSGDAYTLACERPDKINCPEANGPDFDFGSSPILLSLPNGRRALVVGQKSGFVHAVDPDQQGAVLWQVRVGQGGTLGGVQWGSAADSEKVYVALSDVGFRKGDLGAAVGGGALELDPTRGGGLFALRIDTGEKVWHTPAPPPDCTDKKRCSPAQSAAVTLIPGVVFSGSIDGHLRAYSTRDGHILWDFNTAQEYETVNKIKAKGGSIDGPGPTVAGGMLYVNSGYGIFGGMPGNVLLAFSVDGK
jgi:polyvinyl alcohol dehydrogenase (cytochrome)